MLIGLLTYFLERKYVTISYRSEQYARSVLTFNGELHFRFCHFLQPIHQKLEHSQHVSLDSPIFEHCLNPSDRRCLFDKTQIPIS